MEKRKVITEDRIRLSTERAIGNLKAKAYLKNIRNEILEIKELQERRAWLWGEVLPKATRLKDVQVQTSIEPDKLGDNRAEAVDLDNLIQDKIQKMIRDHIKAQELINQIEDPRQRLVLEIYYLSIERKTWTDVADKLGYSESVIFDIHGKALLELDKIIERTSSE